MTLPLARPLDRAEAFFWFLDRCSSMNFAVLAEGSGPLDPARLEAALARALQVHPALGVAIEADASGHLAFVPCPSARVLLTREAVGDDWRVALAARLAQPFEPGDAPLLRAHWFARHGDRWSFALVFHHAICDGRSGIRLVAELIDDARGGRPIGGHRDPRPPMTALFPEALAGAAGLARARAWKEDLRRAAQPPDAVPGFAPDGGPVRPAIVALHFEESVVAGLAHLARTDGASVHGLIGAAELIAARNLFGEAATPALMLTSPVDLRSSLAPPMDDATPGLCVTLLSSTRRVAGPREFRRLAKFVTDDLRRQLAQGYGHLFYHLAPAAETMPATPEAVAAFAGAMRRMPSAFVLSNVGRVAALPDAGGVRVVEVSFALCPMPHQPLFVAASTLAGRLTLNLVHDASRFAPEAARRMAADMAMLLRDAAA